MRITTVLLVLLVVLTIGIRLWLGAQESSFTYESYWALRNAEHVVETGVPLFEDPLKPAERFLFPPLFYYLLAFVASFFPLEFAAELAVIILSSLIIPLVFLITRQLTNDDAIALVTAFCAAIMPIFFVGFQDTVSVHALMLPLVALLFFLLLRPERRGAIHGIVLLGLAVSLTHVSGLIVIPVLLFYLLLLRLESFRVHKRDREIVLFVMFLLIWFGMLLFRDALAARGPFVLWQVAPTEILRTWFQQLTFVQTIYTVGLVPLLLGTYGCYHALFEDKNRYALLFVALTGTSLLLLWFQLIKLQVGLFYLALGLVIMMGYAFHALLQLWKRTKVARAAPFVGAVVLLLILVTSFPAYTLHPPVAYRTDVEAYRAFPTFIYPDEVVFAPIEEGHAIQYYANRPVVHDLNFLTETNAERKALAETTVYTAPFKTDVIRTLTREHADYVLVSRYAQEKYNVTFQPHPDCFTQVYDSPAVYQLHCRIHE